MFYRPLFILNVFEFHTGSVGKSNVSQSKTKSRAVAISKASKPQHANSVEVDEIVLVKIRGWSEWPAIVTALRNEKIHVKFFGDGKTFETKIVNVYKFADCHELILSNMKKGKMTFYKKAVSEAEVYAGIPQSQSITNLI